MKLTVAIPTVHDLDFVLPCLEAIQESFRRLSDTEKREVELMVSVNGNPTWSFENTCKIKDIHWVKIVRHETNIGETANVASIVRGCEGEFLWMIGDDDIIKSEAIGCVLSQIGGGRDYATFGCVHPPDFMHMAGLTDTVFRPSLWREKLSTLYDSASTNLYMAVMWFNLRGVRRYYSSFDLCSSRGKGTTRYPRRQFHPEKFTLALDLIPKEYRRFAARSLLPLVLTMLKREPMTFGERIRETLSLSLRYPLRENLRQWRHHAANILRHA